MATSKLPLSSSPPPPTHRLHVVKAVRRAFRSVLTESRLYVIRSNRRLPCIIITAILLSLALIFLIVLRLLSSSSGSFSIFSRYEPIRDKVFSHNAHFFLPPRFDFQTVRTRSCSWLYLEFNARDGRYLDAFLNNGNHFLEEYLRATQSAMRAFCVIAVDPDPQMAKPLAALRSVRGKKARFFDVFTQMVPSAADGVEQIRFQGDDTDGAASKDAIPATAVALKSLLLNITVPWQNSGAEVPNMNAARGNNNRGNVVLRFNDLAVPEALWYLDLLEALSPTGVLCTRVDRVILSFEHTQIGVEAPASDIRKRDVVRSWSNILTPPSDPRLNSSSQQISAVVSVANAVNDIPGCRARIVLIDSAGKKLTPPVLDNRSVFYAILAGQPTFAERVEAQATTWMTVVPKDRLTVFTNVELKPDTLKAAHGRDVAVVHPHRPKLEQRLKLMQSWSHLVRTRESWDRFMKHDKSIKWLALVDDDTFVFPGGMREYLSQFDHRHFIWGGSGEQARIDNGDTGRFALWLRKIHVKYGGNKCYLSNEKIPKSLLGSHTEYYISQAMNGRKVAKKVSHMCGDMFCKLGCPAVPQGAAIFVSRALVEALRPHIEDCERETSNLCKNCGSQRLYMCANQFVNGSRTMLARGICRSPWKLEHREKFPFALTFHGFNRYRGMMRSTRSLKGDMVELWQLGKSVEEAVDHGVRSSYLIPMPRIADLIGCRDIGRYDKGGCVGKDGKRFPSSDGKVRLRKK